MAQTTPPTISAAPPAPQRGNKATFPNMVDAFLTWLVTAVSQFGAVATNVYSNAVDAFNSATSAANSATAAITAAEAASATANATVWVSGATVQQYANVISPGDGRTYRRITATGSGTTDPRLDTTNYVLVSNDLSRQTADQTITSGGSLTIAHGLGRAPTLVAPFLKNVVADATYAPGDIVAIGWGTGSGTNSYGVSVTADATNIYVTFGGNGMSVLQKSGGAWILITNASWKFFVRAWA